MAEKPIEKTSEINSQVQFSPEEVNAIANEIFKPESGLINEAVKYYTGQEKLEGYQRVLLAPANAFESLITFGVSIFTGKAKEDISALVNNVSDEKTRNMLWNMLKKGWENCTKAEQAAFVTEFISTVLIGAGALGRLKKIIPAEKLAVLQKTATAKRLGALAATIASPLDDVAAVIPSITKKIKKQGAGK